MPTSSDNYTNPAYLKDSQYKDGSNLNARVQLHQRFSTNSYGLHPWIFDQLDLPAEAHILELGAGPGWFFYHNRQRIPAGWTITLSDFSPGMVEEARRNHQETRHPLHFQVIDAQQIPMEDDLLDAIIANHMIYHIPDKNRALAEMRRVLKPGGKLYAATNAADNMQELKDLVRQAVPAEYHEQLPTGGMVESFILDNGAEILAPYFDTVTLLRYEDGLAVTDAQALMDYVLSGMVMDNLGDDSTLSQIAARFRQLVEQRLAQDGVIHIRKSTGIFVAS